MRHHVLTSRLLRHNSPRRHARWPTAISGAREAACGRVANAEGGITAGGARTCRQIPNGRKIPSPTSGNGLRGATTGVAGTVSRTVSLVAWATECLSTLYPLIAGEGGSLIWPQLRLELASPAVKRPEAGRSRGNTDKTRHRRWIRLPRSRSRWTTAERVAGALQKKTRR
jgi:hypothetical protein